MKPVEVTERDRFGYERTFVIRRDEACGFVVFEATAAYPPTQPII